MDESFKLDEQRHQKIYKRIERESFVGTKPVEHPFPATDYIPQNLYCFDIGGNNYRLLTAISFQLGVVTVLDFMTHAEYDKKKLNTR